MTARHITKDLQRVCINAGKMLRHLMNTEQNPDKLREMETQMQRYKRQYIRLKELEKDFI